MFRILHVFFVFSQTIALSGTKLSVLTIEGLLINAVFRFLKFSLEAKLIHSLPEWGHVPAHQRLTCFFFQPKECLTVKEVSKLESWSTSGLWLVRFMELANQKPFQLLAKLLRIQTCIPLFKALTFKLFQLLCTLVYNFLSKLQQDRQGTIYRSHWAAWIKAACWRAWARPPPRRLRWQ